MQDDGGRGGVRTGRDATEPSTGDPGVDEVLAALDRLGDLPVTEHAAVLLEVHERLGGALDAQQALRPGGAHGAP